MCGRFATTRGSAELSAVFEAHDETDGGARSDYNVAPTRAVPIVRISARRDTRVLSLARWGLVPSWARDTRGAARMINARAETIATLRSYARPFARRRCLIPADGWYEWVRREDGGKQPYFMTRRDGGVLALAGVWSAWTPPVRDAADGGDDVGQSVGGFPAARGPLLSFSVVTMPALGELAAIHDRMPLLLSPERWASWLAGGGDPGELLAPPDRALLAGLELRPVGAAVGNVRSNGPELIAAVAEPRPDAMSEPFTQPLF
jgi:putative SOS response-associated peptidase YedK